MTIKIEKSGGKARFKANDQEFLVADDGNVGIGTDSPAAKLDVAGGVKVEGSLAVGSTPGNEKLHVKKSKEESQQSPVLALFSTTDSNDNFKNINIALANEELGMFSGFQDNLVLGTNGDDEKMRITSNGNVGIGTDSPATKLDVVGDIKSTGVLRVSSSGSFNSVTGADLSTSASHTIISSAPGFALSCNHTGSGTKRTYGSFLAEGFTNSHYEGRTVFGGATSSTQVYRVDANGDVRNLNNSYGALSDIKLKENITDSTPKLDDIAAIRFVNYNLKSQPDTKQFGVIAQELEEIFPALVETTPDLDDEGNETGESTKSVKYSVLTLMAVKALQEANDKITALEERLAALEAGN